MPAVTVTAVAIGTGSRGLVPRRDPSRRISTPIVTPVLAEAPDNCGRYNPSCVIGSVTGYGPIHSSPMETDGVDGVYGAAMQLYATQVGPPLRLALVPAWGCPVQLGSTASDLISRWSRQLMN